MKIRKTLVVCPESRRSEIVAVLFPSSTSFPETKTLKRTKKENIARYFTSTSFSLPKWADFPTVIFFGRMQKGENIARMFVFRSPSAPPSIHLASRESEICLKTRSGKKIKTRSPWPIFLNSFYFIQA